MPVNQLVMPWQYLVTVCLQTTEEVAVRPQCFTFVLYRVLWSCAKWCHRSFANQSCCWTWCKNIHMKPKAQFFCALWHQKFQCCVWSPKTLGEPKHRDIYQATTELLSPALPGKCLLSKSEIQNLIKKGHNWLSSLHCFIPFIIYFALLFLSAR